MNYPDVVARLRLPLGFVLGALYLVFAEPTQLGLITGAVVALAGVLLRGWASGYIEKHERLATRGPYAHTRNPLYLGSFLIAAGFAIAVSWALLLVVIAFFALVYAPAIERERATMNARFPGQYAPYSANVPAFVPRVSPWPGARGIGERAATDAFSWRRYAGHGEWKVAVTYVLVIAWLIFRLGRGF